MTQGVGCYFKRRYIPINPHVISGYDSYEILVRIIMRLVATATCKFRRVGLDSHKTNGYSDFPMVLEKIIMHLRLPYT